MAEFSSPFAGHLDLDALTDVVAPSPGDEDVLSWEDDVQAWVSQAASPGGASVPVDNEGVQLTSTVDSFDFVGHGVHATASGDSVTVTIPGAVPDILANRPAAAAANDGMVFYATDVDLAYISNGATWTTLTFDAATALTGTPSGELGGSWASITVDAVHSGSSHAEVDDNAFFYALALG